MFPLYTLASATFAACLVMSMMTHKVGLSMSNAAFLTIFGLMALRTLVDEIKKS